MGKDGISCIWSGDVVTKLGEAEAAAVSWENAGTGQHAGDSGYILSSVSRYLDEFLVEFLRVNEAACGKR